jgi:hypothetical protein
LTRWLIDRLIDWRTHTTFFFVCGVCGRGTVWEKKKNEHALNFPRKSTTLDDSIDCKCLFCPSLAFCFFAWSSKDQCFGIQFWLGWQARILIWRLSSN